MALVDLRARAAGLGEAWSSVVVAGFGDARLKILRMDAGAYPEEVHDYREGLLVLEGEMRLRVGAQTLFVKAGEVYVVEPGVAHAVEPGSHGVLAILDS